MMARLRIEFGFWKICSQEEEHPCKWVCKIKQNAYGMVDNPKPDLLSKGFLKKRTDYDHRLVLWQEHQLFEHC